MPITTLKYKKLFCQTSEDVGSHTRIFTVCHNFDLERPFSRFFNDYLVSFIAKQRFKQVCDLCLEKAVSLINERLDLRLINNRNQYAIQNIRFLSRMRTDNTSYLLVSWLALYNICHLLCLFLAFYWIIVVNGCLQKCKTLQSLMIGLNNNEFFSKPDAPLYFFHY